MNWRLPALTGLAVLALLGPARAQQEPAQKLVLSTDAEDGTYYGIWLRRVYSEALRRLGLQLEVVMTNNKRSAQLASQGLIDGDMVRAPNYGASHPELIRLEAQMYPVIFSLYSRAAAPDVQKLEDLREVKEQAVYRRGVLICERLMKSVMPPERLTEVSTAENALGMLQRGHVRFYCEVDSLINNVMTPANVAKGLTAFKLFDMGEPMFLHGYLHQRHAELAPKLSETLRRMKAEGLFDKYRQEALQQIGASR